METNLELAEGSRVKVRQADHDHEVLVAFDVARGDAIAVGRAAVHLATEIALAHQRAGAVVAERHMAEAGRRAAGGGGGHRRAPSFQRLDVQTQLFEGDLVTALPDVDTTERARLVVVRPSAHGGAHPLTLGRVSDAVATHAASDVLRVRAEGSAKRELP